MWTAALARRSGRKIAGRWVDKAGTVHYANQPAPRGVKARKLDIEARPGAPSPDTQECYTVRCQGERAHSAAAPVWPRGLEFRKYIALERGMSEGELVAIAGAPDLLFRDFALKTYTWLPTPADPFTTSVTVIGGRVSEIERVRKF